MRPDREQRRRAAQAVVRRAARAAGLATVRDDFYSPLVDPDRLPAETWSRQAPMPGVELGIDSALALIDGPLAPLIAEFRPPVHAPEKPNGFFLDNEMYGPMDAHLLYALLRHSPPRRVLELGSGYSTLVIQQALAANETEPRAGHVLVDPYPSQIATGIREVDVRPESAATVDASLFAELGAGDVLFIDTSHVIRPGGEVTRLVLEILPALSCGVVVHIHDIYRPFEYPRVFYAELDVHWQEQYLVQALLAYNDRFEVLCPNHALWRLHRARMIETFTGLHPGREPSGFWIQRT